MHYHRCCLLQPKHSLESGMTSPTYRATSRKLRNATSSNCKSSAKAGMLSGQQIYFRLLLWRICSTGIPPNNHHIQKFGCQLHGEIVWGSALYVQWSNRKCTAAHRADRVQQMHLSDKHPNTEYIHHSGLFPACHTANLHRLKWCQETAKIRHFVKQG